MPMPSEYAHASADFENYLLAALETSGLATRNQVYTMTQGVFHTFRRRLDLEAAILFANVLPAVLRAIFVADWNTREPVILFSDRTAMTREVQALRQDHNFSPDTCIRDVAAAVRRSVNEDEFNRVLRLLPNGAVEFWST
jgi:uncharacterized protein (DUF2267 family)